MSLQKRLRVDLRDALRIRDAERVSLLRTLLAAIDNAEAVDTRDSLGTSEVPRKNLSDADVANVVRNESIDMRAAAAEFEQQGNLGEAQRLRARAAIADAYAESVS